MFKKFVFSLLSLILFLSPFIVSASDTYINPYGDTITVDSSVITTINSSDTYWTSESTLGDSTDIHFSSTTTIDYRPMLTRIDNQFYITDDGETYPVQIQQKQTINLEEILNRIEKQTDLIDTFTQKELRLMRIVLSISNPRIEFENSNVVSKINIDKIKESINE